MKPLYLVVSYRANVDNSYGETITRSDFEMLNTEDQGAAIQFLASILLETATTEKNGYASRENHVFVNGIAQNFYTEDEKWDPVDGWGGSFASEARALIIFIEAAAQVEFQRKLVVHKMNTEKAEIANKAAFAEHVRLFDLNQIELLKKKHGIE